MRAVESVLVLRDDSISTRIHRPVGARRWDGRIRGGREGMSYFSKGENLAALWDGCLLATIRFSRFSISFAGIDFCILYPRWKMTGLYFWKQRVNARGEGVWLEGVAVFPTRKREGVRVDRGGGISE